MKNILYIGPYKENTGLGRTARRYIDALGYNLDINLSIRPIYFTPHLDYGNEAGKDYIEFEDNSSKSYDMVIQHGYANCFEYRSEYGQNVCIPEISTYNIGHTGWIERINMMDTAIVSSDWTKSSVLDAGCNIPIKTIPEPFNFKHFDQNKEYTPIFNTQDEKFVFYYIANHKDKNNINALLAAFFLEFKTHDDVSLIIKTHKEGFTDQEAEQIIVFDIEQLEKCLRTNHNNIIKPHILVGNYMQEYIMRLHKQADCFVNVCRCENFGAAAIESIILR
jgi:glycosyltransferase involved in cell wall biosynthesis